MGTLLLALAAAGVIVGVLIVLKNVMFPQEEESAHLLADAEDIV